MIRRLRIALAGIILPRGSTVLLPLSEAELAQLNLALGEVDNDEFCDDPNCLCRMQVLETEPEVGV